MKKQCVYSITPSNDYIFFAVINSDLSTNGEQWYGDGEERDPNELIAEFEDYARNELGVTDFTPIYVD